ncbi:uncharacterized protein LOC119554745 [Drosophila subpulchrella]|uniref:uncharacterized protein LOC119554745 n=1 Tax=Drosophila subpulchrella TaxID=1486046 RepID=UPI0018A139F8|nr:uncharacterized protein LOC119554745 [Drosophila subpulchrella]
MASEEEEEYTEEETNEAMLFIREHELPMSELGYALKYVRILHGNPSQNNQVMPASMPQNHVAEVEPPPLDWEDEEIQSLARHL